MPQQPVHPLDSSLQYLTAPNRGYRVALYIRVSSEEQLEGYSIDAQLRALRAFCIERNWEIVVEYMEEGRSARHEDLNKRPKFKALLEAADERRYEAVVVHKLDRFARNLSVLLASLTRLGRANVSFVSISEQIDYSTPQGRLFLIMLGALAEWYSNNLSQETKKGKRERKAQGLYNGLLPFGVTQGNDGLPVADKYPFCHMHLVQDGDRWTIESWNETNNFEGLQLAMRLGASGASDSQVARALNEEGYLTTGNRGANHFTKDTVAEILTNRFYWGELPNFQDVAGKDGVVRKVQTGWIKAKHGPFEGFDEALWDRLVATREQNRTRVAKMATKARLYALTGLCRCARCMGPVGIQTNTQDRPRLYCRARLNKDTQCSNKLTFQDTYEEQIERFLDSFVVPKGYQERLIDADERNRSAESRKLVQVEMERIRNLYRWGDLREDEYLTERSRLQRRLVALQPIDYQTKLLANIAQSLQEVRCEWAKATQEGRNGFARRIFDSVLILGTRIIGVKPQSEYDPFFRLNHEMHLESQKARFLAESGPLTKSIGGGSDGDRYPTRTARYLRPHNILPPDIIAQIAATARATSISEAARVHGVARQTVRRALSLAK